MTLHEIIKYTIGSLSVYSNEKRKEFAKTSYPTKMKVIGVVNNDMKQVLKELKTTTKDFSLQNKLELAKLLVNTNIFECQQLAFGYLNDNKKVLDSITENDIDSLQKNMDNWASVDYFGAIIVGLAWQKNIISTEKVKSYYTSNNFWIRRIALVATVSLNQKARGGTVDAKRTLEICELAINDHVDMINKALSWALRELAKRDKKPVEDFIKKYESSLNKRVLSEVKNKLIFGKKNI